MARIVTGSVAERVDPKRRHSTMVRERPSRPNREYRYTITLSRSCSVTRESGKGEDEPECDGRNERSSECKRQDDSKVAKEVLL